MRETDVQDSTETQETGTQQIHLCEIVVDWDDGMSTARLDSRKCPNEAIGKFRFEVEGGMEMERWLCEGHREMYDDAIIEEVA